MLRFSFQYCSKGSQHASHVHLLYNLIVSSLFDRDTHKTTVIILAFMQCYVHSEYLSPYIFRRAEQTPLFTTQWLIYIEVT